MRATRNLLLAPFLSLALAGCDGEIVVSGTVSDEQETTIPEACVFLGDRVYDDFLNNYLAGKDAEVPCWQQTDPEGHFKTNAIVAGSGKHDFWIVAWKEGYAAHSQRVWRGDGSPSGPVDVSITLASE
jgi:hypothetical protein